MLQGRSGSIFGAILGAKWEAKGAKMPPKNDLKIDEISQDDAKMHEENHVIFY